MLIEKPRLPIRDILLYGLWPNFLKKLIYRIKGHQIGKGVSLGFGSVLIGKHVEIGDYTSIGFLTIIRGKDVRIGDYVQIGAMTFLDTPYMQIGEGTKINEQVFVGGLQNPDSRFVVGRNCQIMQYTFINPALSVTIGDDSGIGGHCLIFGHSSFQNQFDGYPAESAPIEIGNSAGLAWRVFVLPGTKIGDGAMVGANSVVSGTVPGRSLAVGFPARIVGKPPVFPREVSDSDKVELFQNIVGEMIEYFSGSGLDCVEADGIHQIRKSGGRKTWTLRSCSANPAETPAIGALDVFLSLWEISEQMRDALTSRNIMWIDISRRQQSRLTNDLGNEVLLFFKRHGVRTLRYPSLVD